MNCEAIREWILWYPGEGELTPTARQQVVLHTVKCQACRVELARTLALARSLADALVAQGQAARTHLTATDLPAPRDYRTEWGERLLERLMPALARIIRDPLATAPPAVRGWMALSAR